MRFYLDNFKSFIIEKNPIEIIQIFIQYIKDISFYNTPYIKFLKLFEDAFKFLKLDYNVISFDIKVYQVLIILVIVNFFFFKNRKLFFLNLSNLIIFMFVIFFVKNYQFLES